MADGMTAGLHVVYRIPAHARIPHWWKTKNFSSPFHDVVLIRPRPAFRPSNHTESSRWRDVGRPPAEVRGCTRSQKHPPLGGTRPRRWTAGP